MNCRRFANGLLVSGCLIAGLAAPLGLIGVAPAGAAVILDELPTLDEVFANCTKAVGGQEAVDKIKTLHVVSSMTMMGQEAGMEQMWNRSGGRLVKMDIPGMGSMLMGTDGKTSWMKSPMGYMLTSDEQTAQLRGQAGMFMSLLDPKQFAKEDLGEVKVVGKESFNGADCYKLHYKGIDGNEGHIFFDTKSGLPIGFMQNETDMGGTSTMTLSDWKEVDGVKFFHSVKVVMGEGNDAPADSPEPQMTSEQRVEMKVTSIKVNALTEEAFALPEEVKAMTEPKKNDAGAAAATDRIKLEDLPEDQRKEATDMVEHFRKLAPAQREQAATGLQMGMAFIPAEQQKMMEYVLQELHKMPKQ